MKQAKNITYSLSFRIISSIVFLLLVFSTIASTIGYIRFTDSLTKEYNDSAFRTAETAVTLINGDKSRNTWQPEETVPITSSPWSG